MRLRILVVERNDLVRLGACALLVRQPWVARCCAAASARQALALARRLEPHVAVVALELGPDAGTVVARELRAVWPATRVLLLADGAPRALAPAVRAAGAVGVLSPAAESAALAEAVRRAWLGRAVSAPVAPPEARVLSRREREILAHIAAGATNREIAVLLDLSPHTVKQHASAAFRKLAARNRADAVRRGQRLGLIA